MKLNRRLLLYVWVPLAVALVVLAALTRAVLLHSAAVGTRFWLTGAAERVLPRLNALESSGFPAELASVEATVAGPTWGAERSWPDGPREAVWGVRGADGSLVAGWDCVPSGKLLAGEAGYADCGGRAALVSERSVDGATLTVGRWIDQGYVDAVADVVQAEAMVLDGERVILSSMEDADGSPYLPDLAAGAEMPFRPEGGPAFGKFVASGAAYRGYYNGEEAGNRALACYGLSLPLGPDSWMLIAVPESILQLGAIYSTRAVTAAMGVTLAGVALSAWFFARRVSGPLGRLADQARKVGGGDLNARIEAAGDAELSELARAFNAMVDALKQGRSDLAEASRMAGRAEVATGVLHNVGNVLNSVNVAADMVRTAITAMGTDRLVQAANLLAEHVDDLPRFVAEDPRGRAIPTYLVQASMRLATDRDRVLGEVAVLKLGVERIKAIVATQQSQARRLAHREAADLSRLVDEALRTVAAERVDAGVAIRAEHAAGPAITVDASLVADIVLNLVRNAYDAVADQPAGTREIWVRTFEDAEGSKIEVVDSGVGIASEKMSRMFQFGHTTKADGHGFGLHMSALAAQGMGGALACHSDGAGKGARFTLQLPASPPTNPLPRGEP